MPIYNWAMGHHPQRAYALASVGVTAAAWSAIGTQVATGTPLAPADLGLAVYAFILITLTALGVQPLLVAEAQSNCDLDYRPLAGTYRHPLYHAGTGLTFMKGMITMTTTTEVMNALKKVMDPELHRNVVELNMVRDLSVKDGKVSFTLALTIPECPLRDQLQQDARAAVQALPGVQEVQVTLGAMTEEERRAVLGRPRSSPGWPQPTTKSTVSLRS